MVFSGMGRAYPDSSIASGGGLYTSGHTHSAPELGDSYSNSDRWGLGYTYPHIQPHS